MSSSWRIRGRYLELKGKLDGLSLDEESRKRELDFVRFEIDEIEDSALKPGEEEELAAKAARLNELNALLNLDKKENEIVDGERGEEELSRSSDDRER